VAERRDVRGAGRPRSARPAPEGASPRPAPGPPVVEVTRTFQFSAAHRMHNPRFSAARNRRLYGRCNHPSGHGHTYRVAVTVRGPIAPGTGRLPIADHLPRLVRTHVLARFDQANLDHLIAPADGVTSTTEVLAGLLWRILERAIPGDRLARLRVEETFNNFFELEREDLTGRRIPSSTGGPRRAGAGKRDRA
jgi:6-pyruvoyltetrahydropterin/6-carboxytetrahydropterin synthase